MLAADWLSQASFEPPLIMIAVKTDNDSHAIIERSGVLAINVIGGNRLFDCLIGAIASAFKSCVLFPVPKTANVVALASMRAQADMEAAIKSTAASPALLADNGVDLALFRAEDL